MLSYRTAGESHGKGIAALVEGFPAGVVIDTDYIASELRRRQCGYGRGGRQNIETDSAEVMTGILHGVSMGSPILLWVKNRDYKLETMPELVRPRPGHGDLSGSIKFFSGIRAILERASARETAGRVAAGALARLLLREVGIELIGYVQRAGGVDLTPDPSVWEKTPAEIRAARDQSELFALANPEAEAKAKQAIDDARSAGDTLGGVVEVRVFNVPFGLGAHTQWVNKLDGKLARAIASIQAFKGVEIGDGFKLSELRGSQAHDEIGWNEEERGTRRQGIVRPTNHAGGLECGMTNGQTIIIRAAKKPIPTLRKQLKSIDLSTKSVEKASFERSDICAIAAASVVVENVVGFEIASALVEKFGGDSLREIKDRIDLFERSVAKRLEDGEWMS